MPTQGNSASRTSRIKGLPKQSVRGLWIEGPRASDGQTPAPMRYLAWAVLGIMAKIFALGVQLEAKEGWYQGQAESIYVSNSGRVSVRLTPDPADDGFGCRNGFADVWADVEDLDSAWRIVDRMHKLFADAMARNAQVSVYLEDRTRANGSAYCAIDRAQIWKTEDKDPVLPPVQPPGSGVGTGGGTGPGSGSGTGSGSGGTTATTVQYYGALAIGDDLALGVSWNNLTQAEADSGALGQCREYGTGCVIQARVGNGQCLAVATNRTTGGWGGAIRATAAEAKSAALSNCDGGCALAWPDSDICVGHLP